MLRNQNIKFKKILILFWTCWWLIAFWTDLSGSFKSLGLINVKWIYADNFPGLQKSLEMYSAPHWLAVVLFIGIIVWMLISTLLFIHASIALHKDKSIWMQRAARAFIVSLSLWLAFFLADQIVMKFMLEENHMVQGGFELLSFFALYVLPE